MSGQTEALTAFSDASVTRSETIASSPARVVTRPPRAAARWTWLAVAALLAAYAAMSYTASLSKGLSFDEGEQLAVGYNIWLNNDYRIEGANGDFIKRWATLPYLITRPRFVGRDDPDWHHGEPYKLGYRFFFELGNRPESLLRQARAMEVLLGVIAAWLVFICARELFGTVGGLTSLGLFAFSPHMLAFGGIVSTDMSITLLLFASTWCIWRLLHEITWRRLLLSLVVLGLLLLAKLSALAIVPVAAVLVAVRLFGRRPLIVRWREHYWSVTRRRKIIPIIAVLALAHVLAGWAMIWANYGFRYSASPNPADPTIIIRPQPQRDGVPTTLAATIAWARETHFLPEGFRRGVNWLLGVDDGLGSFMDGKWRGGGWLTFFPYALWVKTQPSVMAILAFGLFWWSWRRHRGQRRSAEISPPKAAPSFYAATPYVVLIVVYLAVAMTEDINLGHRHVLPIYPALYVLAGAASLAWTMRNRWLRVVVLSLLAWMVRDSLSVRPDYLAYFGAQAGGPAQGYRHLVDSSLDWGMDLPRLKQWLNEHNPGGKTPVFLGYFGTDDPRYYGIKARTLPGFFDWHRKREVFALQPGYYAISASLLQGVYTSAFGPWSNSYEFMYQETLGNFNKINRLARGSAARNELFRKYPIGFWNEQFFRFENLRFARLCAWLRHHGDPPYNVGHSILIWKLDYAALHTALLEAPVELVDEPSHLRHQ